MDNINASSLKISAFESIQPASWTVLSRSRLHLSQTERNWNLGLNTGDDSMNVMERRSMLANKLKVSIPWLTQVHGTEVAVFKANQPYLQQVDLVADACISNQPDIACAVLTADCCPILLANEDGSCWGAIHAGWRGLAAGIIANTLRAVDAHFHQDAEKIQCWIGPTIRREHYEVDDTVKQTFFDLAPSGWHADMAEAFSPSLSRPEDARYHQCDLVDLVILQLRKLGVKTICDAGLDSFNSRRESLHPDQPGRRFYSHRRYCSNKERPEEQPGRMASIIAMSPDSLHDENKSTL